MGVKAVALIALLLAAPLPALADEVSQCESRAASDFAADPSSSNNARLHIDRDALSFDRAEVMAGREFVSSVLHGPASLDGATGTTRVRFVCLYGGDRAGPLFVWVLPE